MEGVAFAPPAQYGALYRECRPPLQYDNGGMVTEAAGWPARRNEILSYWRGKMGEWPALLAGQRLRKGSATACNGYVRYHVAFEWLPGQPTDGYLLVPPGDGKKPAMITVYYEPETSAGIGDKGQALDFAHQLARRGFVTLSLGTRDASRRSEFALFWPDVQNARLQPLAALACAAANAYEALAGEESVDAARVGIMGHSFGGKWAMFGAAFFECFACGVWSDPGIVFDDVRPNINYWEPWYLGYHPKPWRKRGLVTPENPCHGIYRELRQARRDLAELHALLAPRPFMVSGGSEDSPARWEVLNHIVALNQMLGFKGRVAMANRPQHEVDAAAAQQMYWFVENCLLRGGASKEEET